MLTKRWLFLESILAPYRSDKTLKQPAFIRDYYAIAIAHFSKLRNKTVQEINHLYAQQKITQAERAQRLKELAEENHTFMNMLDKYAEKFALTVGYAATEGERLRHAAQGRGEERKEKQKSTVHI